LIFSVVIEILILTHGQMMAGRRPSMISGRLFMAPSRQHESVILLFYFKHEEIVGNCVGRHTYNVAGLRDVVILSQKHYLRRSCYPMSDECVKNDQGKCSTCDGNEFVQT
jgi:hypothetical protein